MRSVFLIGLSLVIAGCSSAPLKRYHTEKLNEEFTQSKAERVKTLNDYKELEGRLFAEMDEKIYQNGSTGAAFITDRYSPNSAADPRKFKINYNRTLELSHKSPKGGVLMLHGMSDSPYALRSLGLALNKVGYYVLLLRMPGHGTIPSGLRHISRQDMSAAVELGIRHLQLKLNAEPIHLVGYSTGAPLAVEYSLNSFEDKSKPIPASINLISPAIGVHSAAAMARFKNGLSFLPGLSHLAYLQVQSEFDPFKYNSFATNAASLVHRLTSNVNRRLLRRVGENPKIVLPPTKVYKSTVDATVTTNAVIDQLLIRLKPNRHELLLFDINRHELVKSRLLVNDPAPMTDRVYKEKFPFNLKLVQNINSSSKKVHILQKPPFKQSLQVKSKTKLYWPPGVISLSHVAVPIKPSDPLYGQRPPKNNDFIFLGNLALKGERGLINVPDDWLIRLRYNPFYSLLESELIDWIEKANSVPATSSVNTSL